MFAVIRTGGKQYKVANGDVIDIESIIGDAGGTVTFGEVLMLGGDSPKSGAPLISGDSGLAEMVEHGRTAGAPLSSCASLLADIVEHGRHPKVVAFKKKRRKNTHRKRGHRQHFTKVKVLSISAGKVSVMAHKKAG